MNIFIFIALLITAPGGFTASPQEGAVPAQAGADLPPGIVAAAGDIAVTEAEFHAYVIAEHGGSDTGLALLDQIINETAIRQEAKRRGLPAIRVTTTNDNIPALALYQTAGFRIESVGLGCVARHHGREERGWRRLPVRDEIRLVKETGT